MPIRTNHRRRTWLLIAPPILLLALLLAPACGDDDELPPTSTTSTRSATSTLAPAAQISPNLPPEDLIETLRRDLANRLGVNPDAITVVEHCFVTWPDASVGVAEPGRVYTQGLIDGWFVLLEHDGTEYRIHGAEARYVIANLVPDAIILDFRCP